MELTDPQRRTLEQLIGTERPVFAADLAQRLRDRIEEAARGLELTEVLWLGKECLNDLGKCEGMFWSKLSGEGLPFVHNAATAVGVVQHRAIEAVVGAREPPGSARGRAHGRDAHGRPGGALRRVLARAERSRTGRPADGGRPPDRVVRRIVPTAARPAPRPVADRRAVDARRAARGSLVVSGKVDLVLGRPDMAQPMRGQRLLIDLKTGGAYPEHARTTGRTRCCTRFGSASRPTASPRSSSRAARGRRRTSTRNSCSMRPIG